MNARVRSTDSGTGPLESLADTLKLDELAALTAGVDAWRTTSLPERGVPRLKMSDGPFGVRGESFTSTTSALFPCGTALGATFDRALVRRIGEALGHEARTKAAHVLLGPTLNVQRHPLGGRNFESFGEDPHLIAEIATAYVAGLQSTGIAACIKHLVANDAEIERLTISSEVDVRTLREVYLRPFEAVVADADAWSIMASYNRLNGVFACENRWLLTDVARSDWDFPGVIVSDWFATHDTLAAARSGLDLEMPGPARRFGPALADAVRAGHVDETDLREMARRFLRLADRVGATPADEERTERSVDDPARWSLAVDAAAAATVLLTNRAIDGAPVLPLDASHIRRIAVIGPDADLAVVQGGGSARVNPHRTVSPLAALRALVPPAVEVVHSPGCARGEPFPVLAGPVEVEYRDHPGGPVIATTSLPRFDPLWSGRFDPTVDPNRFHVRAQVAMTPEASGEHGFDLQSVGPCTVTLDGVLLLDNREPVPGPSFFGYGSQPVRTTVALEAGRTYRIEVEYDRTTGNPAMAGVRVGMQRPLGDDPLGDAAASAASADVAVIVVGTNEDVETEGLDRTTMSLPGGQDELVRRVAAANPRTVVVVVAGAAVDMPWADDVAAIVVPWFGGMGAGEALARVLLGVDEPGGRLPITIPYAVEDAPCDISRGDPPGQLHYTEQLAVGHRWYIDHAVEPRWWFGSGTGYATFEWGAPVAAASVRAEPGVELDVTVPVRNTGERSGSDVVQVYLHRPASAVVRPAWVLGGFTRVQLAPGESTDAVVHVDPRALRHWDGDLGWQVEPGPLEVRVARSAGDAGATLVVALDRDG